MAEPILTLQKRYLPRKSFVCLIFQLLFSQLLFILVIASLHLIFGEFPFFYFIYIINVLALIIIFLKWHFDYYIISLDAISHTQGILYKRTETYDLQSIRSVHVLQSFVGIIFGYGTVVLISPLLEKHVNMDKVHNPYSHAKTIDTQRLKFIEGKPLGNITPVIGINASGG